MSIDPRFRTKLLTSAGGSKMPKGWQSPMRNADGTRKALFASIVTTRDGQRVKVGPGLLEDFARQFHDALVLAIKTGKLTGWSDPTLERVA